MLVRMVAFSARVRQWRDDKLGGLAIVDRPAPGLGDVAAERAATYAVSRDRLAGYRDADERHGLDWSQVSVHQGTDSTEEGEVGAAAILPQTPRPTAILCLSDRLAEGALRAAQSSAFAFPGTCLLSDSTPFPPAPHST